MPGAWFSCEGPLMAGFQVDCLLLVVCVWLCNGVAALLRGTVGWDGGALAKLVLVVVPVGKRNHHKSCARIFHPPSTIHPIHEIVTEGLI